MTRPESPVLFVAMVVPLVLTRRSATWRERITQLSLAAIIPIVAFAPWIAYNMTRFEQPVTISTGSGQTLAAGNCEHTYSGLAVGYYDLRCLRSPAIEVPTGDPSENDPVYRELALSYMSEHRGELPRVLAIRWARLWHVYGAEQSLNLDGWVEGRSGGPPGTDRSVVRAALLSYFALVPFSVAGGVVLLRRRVALWPLLVQPLLATVVAAFTFGITRYRAGAEITLVVLAAVALCAAWDVVAKRRAGPATAGADTAGPGATDPRDRTDLQ
ncbi:MAG: hypothetical protein ACYC2O_11245, partial [Microthrixaceae bacterium]